jgi:hypothetical protein
MPRCCRCHAHQVPAEGDFCASCWESQIAEAMDQEEKDLATLRAYTGDQFLTDSWLEDGLSIDAAKAIVEDPTYIGNFIEFGLLESVLADKFATAVLRNCLLDRKPRILEALGRYVHLKKIRKKAGRKPKGPEPIYVTVYNLRKSGLTFGRIAQRMWGTASKGNLASAHYQRAIKLGFPPIKTPRK